MLKILWGYMNLVTGTGVIFTSPQSSTGNNHVNAVWYGYPMTFPNRLKRTTQKTMIN